MRNTLQKDIIRNSIGDANDHPTAEDVYARVHESYPRISKATVYRVLKQSADNDELTRITVIDGADCYDKNTVKHYHIKCVKCGSISDASIEYQHELDGMQELKCNWKILGHDILFKGVCNSCSKLQ